MSYINPASLGRTRGRHLFVTIEGVNITATASHALTFTSGDTSITCKSFLYIVNNVMLHGEQNNAGPNS